MPRPPARRGNCRERIELRGTGRSQDVGDIEFAVAWRAAEPGPELHRIVAGKGAGERRVRRGADAIVENNGRFDVLDPALRRDILARPSPRLAPERFIVASQVWSVN
jgi:hypothetical protein